MQSKVRARCGSSLPAISRLALILVIASGMLLAPAEAAQKKPFTSYYKGATVFRDQIPNGVQDEAEKPGSVTNEDGSFFPPKGKGRLYLRDGVDILTNQKNALVLNAPTGVRGISTLTALWQALLDRTRNNQARVKKLLNVKSNITQFSAVAPERANKQTKAVLKRDAQQSTLARFLKSLTSGGSKSGLVMHPVGVSASVQREEDPVIAQLAASLIGLNQKTVDVAIQGNVEALLSRALSGLGVTISPQQLALVAKSASQINGLIDQKVEQLENLQQISGEAATLIEAGDYERLAKEYTDAALTDKVVLKVSLVSRDSAGNAAGNMSLYSFAMSGNGRYVAFEAYNSLTREDTNNTNDIYLRDTVEGTTRVISRNSQGVAAGGDSPSISEDGRYLAFRSYEALVPEDTNFSSDAYLYDIQNGTYRLVSADSQGGAVGADYSDLALSADGRYVAFGTYTALLSEDTNGNFDVYVRDMATNGYRFVALNAPGTSIDSNGLAISADGRYLSFDSYTALLPEDINQSDDSYWYDTQTRNLQMVTPGGANNFYSFHNSNLSANGQYVAFATDAALVPEDTNGSTYTGFDVYLRDTFNNAYRYLSHDRKGKSVANAFSFAPQISSDGRYVAYISSAGLVPQDVNHTLDLYFYDTVRNINRYVSLDQFSKNAYQLLFYSLSGNGHNIAFVTTEGLVPEDTNGTEDIYQISGW